MYDFLSIQTEIDSAPDRPRGVPAMWLAALAQYVEDLKHYQHYLAWTDVGSPKPADHGEAWRDFRSFDRPMLTHLCAMAQMDVEYIMDGLRRCLRDTLEGGMQ